MKKTLWTRNFTIITLGTIISAIGGTALNLALSVVVFDNTGSAILTSLFAVIGLIPGMVIPIVIAPYMDAHPRRPVIFTMDFVSAIVYLGFGLYVVAFGFHYVAYLIFGFLSASISSIYRNAYSSLYPDLIPEGYMQKGYSVSSLIYPTTMVIMMPVAAVIYTSVGIETLFFLEAGLLVVASIMEWFIVIDETKLLKAKVKFKLSLYLLEIKEGFDYLKKEKGIFALYCNMSIMQGTSTGGQIMQMSYFQTNPMLGTVLYSVFLGANTLGRVFGGLFHYFVKFPANKKYFILNTVYKTYSVVDMIVLFLPFPLMMVAQCFTGVLGVNSATLRDTAVQQQLPANIRSRINALLNVMIEINLIVFQLLAGVMAEFMGYLSVIVTFSLFGLLASFFFVDRNRNAIKAFMNRD